MKQVNPIFMAFASGQESTEGVVIKRYIGVAPVFILAVNPTKAELDKIYNTEFDKAPEYITEKDGVKSVRLDFVVKTDPEKSNGIELLSRVAFFLRNEPRYNKDKTKVQVIDKYGRTAWATIEQAKAHEIPVNSNGPAQLDSDYRPCYVGEEDLTNFIKNYLNIPNVMKYVNKTWVLNDNPSDSEARLEGIASLFNNDFKELQSVIKLQPNNKVKLMFGIRNTDDGKQYQAVYTAMTLKNSVTDYSKLDADLKARQEAGSASNTEYLAEEIREYVVESSALTPKDSSDLPFEAGTAGNSPW